MSAFTDGYLPPMEALLTAFRDRYHLLELRARDVVETSFGDSTLLERANIELSEFVNQVNQVRYYTP